jgi:hypothetical protein
MYDRKRVAGRAATSLIIKSIVGTRKGKWQGGQGSCRRTLNDDDGAGKNDNGNKGGILCVALGVSSLQSARIVPNVVLPFAVLWIP